MCAPYLSELFAAPTITNNVAKNPISGENVTVLQTNLGDPNLRAEIARNTELGIVPSRPTWLPGFSASFDYYAIKAKDVVSTLSGHQQVDLCYLANHQDACSAILLTSPLPNGVFVDVQAFNLASVYTNDCVIEASYRMPLSGVGLPGTFTVRGLATHVLHDTSTSGILNTIPSELAGVNLDATPSWKLLGTQSWDTDAFSLTLTERWISDGVRYNFQLAS